MKLDAKQFRYLTSDDWRVLTAFEMGSKNHEVVPTSLAIQLAALKTGTNGVNRSISTLAKGGLVAKVKNAKYDGYRLTYGGYDYLALHALTRSDAILQLGSTIGVGKESDILLVTSPSPTGASEPVQAVLKIHRLGRTSFRTVANNRAYLGKRTHTSWQYMSRLSAQREVAAMRILCDAGLEVPRPIGHSRHAVVMSLVPGTPLRAVPLHAFGRSRTLQELRVASLYGELMEIILSLAERGIIHGDMNEFNIMLEGVTMEQLDAEEIDEDTYEERTALEEGNGGTASDLPAADPAMMQSNPPNDIDHDLQEDAVDDLNITPHIIDFPQITSMSHAQASEYFQRDVDGVKAFFRKRYHFESDDRGPTYADASSRLETAADRGIRRLDIQIEAAGFDKKAAKQLIGYYAGAEVDLNDIEVDLDIGGDSSLIDGADEQLSGMTGSFARSSTKITQREKAAAGWSL